MYLYFRYSIPKDSHLSAIWLKRINNPKLNAPGAKLGSCFICEEHFHSMCFEEKAGLRRYSLPTINLPSK
nr:unnamed protein product [Callosobruchus analis]